MTTIDLKTKYVDAKAVPAFGEYENGRRAIKMLDAKTGEELMIATVNIPEIKVPPDYFFIKNYSENEGLTDCLERQGFIDVVRRCKYGDFRVSVDLCKLRES